MDGWKHLNIIKLYSATGMQLSVFVQDFSKSKYTIVTV